MTIARSAPTVYHAYYASVSGIAVTLTGVTYFCTCDDDPSLYIVRDPQQLLLTGVMAEPVAAVARAQISAKFQRNALVALP